MRFSAIGVIQIDHAKRLFAFKQDVSRMKITVHKTPAFSFGVYVLQRAERPGDIGPG